MRYEKTFQLVKELAFDTEYTICEDHGTTLFIYRPSKLSKRFKDYDVTKNFQIWLRDGDRAFRPNHLRILIDLNLRIRSRPDLKKQLLSIFDNIYYKSDPDEEVKIVEGQNFSHYLNSIKVTANLTQLFLIEQEYCYHKPSSFDPATLFFQGWVREFIDNPKEIDNLCMSVCRGQPPEIKYTCQENKKHKMFVHSRPQFWYTS
jgi:hypothetical protein